MHFVCVPFHLKINMYSNHFQSILIRVSFQKIYIHTKNFMEVWMVQMIFRISKKGWFLGSSGWVLLGEYYHRNHTVILDFSQKPTVGWLMINTRPKNQQSTIPRDPGSPSENGFREPKNYSIRFGGDWTPTSFSDNMTWCLGRINFKTNIAPENRLLEKDIPIGNHHF